MSVSVLRTHHTKVVAWMEGEGPIRERVAPRRVCNLMVVTEISSCTTLVQAGWSFDFAQIADRYQIPTWEKSVSQSQAAYAQGRGRADIISRIARVPQDIRKHKRLGIRFFTCIPTLAFLPMAAGPGLSCPSRVISICFPKYDLPA